jgi:hypothetical protein
MYTKRGPKESSLTSCNVSNTTADLKNTLANLVDGKLTVRSSSRRIWCAPNGVTSWYIIWTDFTADICNEAQSTVVPIFTSGSRTKMIVIITAKPGFVGDFASHRVRGAVDDVNSRILCRGSLEKAYDGKDLNKFHDVALVFICWLVSLV